jgi:N-methylhydantoinase B
VWRVPDDEYAPQPPVNLGIQSGRFRYPPEALAEGRPGALAQFLVNGKSGNPYGLTQLRPGDVVVMDAAGGGGYGDPLTRDPELVAADVADGLVSLDAAREDYAVVLDAVTFRVDAAKTAELRRARLSLAGHASTMPPR